MQTFLTIWLLATFIDTGESFQCEHCYGLGRTCKGPLADCPSDTDTCGIIQISSSGVSEEEVTVKTCLRSRYCKRHHLIDFGITGQLSTRTTCCMGKECEVIPPVPPIHTTPNGKKCPACYSLTKPDCKGVVAECTGDNTDCVEVRGTASSGFQNVTFVLKACTNYDVCRDTFLGFSSESFTTDRCAKSPGRLNAIVGAGPPVVTPGSPLLFLQTFSGLLLLKLHL